MKISTKLAVFFVAVLAMFGVLGGSLFVEINEVTDGYERLRAGPIRDMEAARVVQLNFKKQVQEWKDILLRGSTPADLERYTRQFHDKSAEVRAGAVTLAQTTKDPEASALLQQFVAAHEEMAAKYEAAYQIYVSGGGDFMNADAKVRGQDRAPTDIFDRVVARLADRVEGAVAEQHASVQKQRMIAFGTCGGLILAIILLGGVTVRSALARIAQLKVVSDRLARADVDGLAVDISGKDEIGAFGESMKGVRAAFEELMRTAA